jgi:hypothetical protein
MFGRAAAMFEQERAVDQFDMDAAILNGLDGDLHQLLRGCFWVGKGAGSDEFHGSRCTPNNSAESKAELSLTGKSTHSAHGGGPASSGSISILSSVHCANASACCLASSFDMRPLMPRKKESRGMKSGDELRRFIRLSVKNVLPSISRIGFT